MEFNLAFNDDGQPELKSACGRCRELLPDESVVTWLLGAKGVQPETTPEASSPPEDDHDIP